MLRTKLKLAVHQTPLRDLLIIEHNVFRDERGWFYESFNQKEFNSATGINYQFVQDNHSQSKQGILRGLHYQTQHTQGKLVRVTHGQELSADNQLQMWIPPGFAHGFLTLSETAEFLYKTTDYYNPESDNCLLWNDPIVNIQWPLHRILRKPQLSEKDSEGAAWDDAKKF